MNKNKVVKSLIYKFIERILVKGLGLIISVVLARLLLPEEFGLIAIILVFMDIGQSFVQGGLNTALVQSKKTSRDDYSTVFILSECTACLIIILLWLISPLIDRYYDNIGLILPIRIYSFSLIFAAFNSIQIAKLQREMKFKEMMVCTLAATIISGILGIVTAICNFGIWALIMYYFSYTVISCITMMGVSKWYPKMVFSIIRAKELYSYGWKMLVSSVLCSLYNNLRSLIIGKIFSQSELGYYNRGQQFPDIIGSTLDVSIQSVMFPILSDVQENRDAIKKMLRKSISFGSFIIFPTMLGLLVVSKPLILVLLTDKWLPCVIYMQIICLGNVTIPLVSSNLVAIKATGRSDVYMKLEFVRRVMMLTILIISLVFFRSVKSIAYGYAISSWCDFLIITIVANKMFDYGLKEQMYDIWKNLIASVMMAFIIYAIGKIYVNNLLLLFVQVIAGVIIYIIISKCLKSEELLYVIQLKNKYIK